jgi:hypothetical protein
MIKREMKFADACLDKHKTARYRDWFKMVMFDYATDLIDRYNAHLLKHGYTDTDIVTEFNLDEWLRENL